MVDLTQIERALLRAFPDLSPIAPVRLLGTGFSSVAVETAGGVVFRIAQSASAGANYAKEARNLPALRPYLPVAIPEPGWYIPASEVFPFGVIGYRKLSGAPLEPGDLRTLAEARKVAAQVAAIILALHRAPLDALHLRHELDARRAEWKTQRDAVLPALRAALRPDEVRAVARWWDAFLADDRMLAYAPALQHGDLWFGNLLVEGTHVTGVVDFERLGIGDPALDFTPQLYLGEAFLNLVIEAYQEAGGALDAHFDHRLRRLWALREFGGVQYALEHNDAEEFADSIAKIRKGPILNAAGLDGWRRGWGTS